MRGLIFGCLAGSLLFAAVAQATTFDTTYAWNGISSIGTYGSPNTATYGQTIIAPSDNVLNDFTFYLRPGGATFTSRAYVYAWQGSLFGGGGGRATGPALFESSSFVTSGSAFQPVTINTGGVALSPGAEYVLFLTVSNPSDYAATTGSGFWGTTGHVANDGGGGFVFYNNGANFGLLNTSTWDNFADFGDLAYTAHFTSEAPAVDPVPEPSTILLFGAGLAGVGLLRRRAKK